MKRDREKKRQADRDPQGWRPQGRKRNNRQREKQA